MAATATISYHSLMPLPDRPHWPSQLQNMSCLLPAASREAKTTHRRNCPLQQRRYQLAHAVLLSCMLLFCMQQGRTGTASTDCKDWPRQQTAASMEVTPTKLLTDATARCSSASTTLLMPCVSSTQPGLMKRAPSSAMLARARMDVSANWLPRCSSSSSSKQQMQQAQRCGAQ
jgi:hypothetical protein